MNILVLGGTRYFGIRMIRQLLKDGHQITIATRGNTKDEFSEAVSRLTVERTNPESLKTAFANLHYDVICDNLAYCSNDIKYILDIADCDRYVMTSSTAVYKNHLNTVEEDFNPLKNPFQWCSRNDYPYDETKRQAECAVFQKYPTQKAVAVRFPFVIGEDDYTKRLFFYVEHTIKGIPMFIDNPNEQMGFVRSDEAGNFLALLAEQDYVGCINGCSSGSVSVAEIIAYIEGQTGKKAVYSQDGDVAPYNGVKEYSINTARARNLGFQFTPLHQWIYQLLDTYIQLS